MGCEKSTQLESPFFVRALKSWHRISAVSIGWPAYPQEFSSCPREAADDVQLRWSRKSAPSAASLWRRLRSPREKVQRARQDLVHPAMMPAAQSTNFGTDIRHVPARSCAMGKHGGGAQIELCSAGLGFRGPRDGGTIANRFLTSFRRSNVIAIALGVFAATIRRISGIQNEFTRNNAR